jgi:hypothetical protein
MGRVDRSHNDNDANSFARGNATRLRSNGANGNKCGGKKLHLDKHEDEPKDNTRGKGKGKGELRHKRRFEFNASVKALTSKEQQSHRDGQFCYKCRKPGHRMSKCSML